MPGPRSETESALEYEVRIDAAPETVFAYFTDPVRMVQWIGTEAVLDPRPGGICRINPSGHAVMSGQFVEVDPPHRIVFSWGWETELFATPPLSTLVEVSLTAEGEQTILRLSHQRLQSGALGFHRAGWDHYLPRLAAVASGEQPSSDPWRDVAIATARLRDAGVLPL